MAAGAPGCVRHPHPLQPSLKRQVLHGPAHSRGSQQQEKSITVRQLRSELKLEERIWHNTGFYAVELLKNQTFNFSYELYSMQKIINKQRVKHNTHLKNTAV